MKKLRRQLKKAGPFGSQNEIMRFSMEITNLLVRSGGIKFNKQPKNSRTTPEENDYLNAAKVR